MTKEGGVIFSIFYWIQRSEEDDTVILLGIFSSYQKAELFKKKILNDYKFSKIIDEDDLYIEAHTIDKKNWTSGYETIHHN